MAENLSGRLAERQNGGAEVATRSGYGSMAEFLRALAPEMARALPKYMSADRMVRLALTEMRRTPRLVECTQESWGGALMTCSQLGLEPGAIGEVWLLPFWNNKTGKYEVTLVIGYQGMVKLFWQSPMAKSIDAQTVYEADHFEYEYGLEPKLIHRPPPLGGRGEPSGGRGKAIGYYAVATTKNGGSAFIVMSRPDVEAIRKRSKAKDDGPWRTDFDAMSRKTCVRQLFKLLPKSTELAQALAHDETVRTDRALDGIDSPPAYVEGEVVTEAGPTDTATGEITEPGTDAEHEAVRARVQAAEESWRTAEGGPDEPPQDPS